MANETVNKIYLISAGWASQIAVIALICLEEHAQVRPRHVLPNILCQLSPWLVQNHSLNDFAQQRQQTPAGAAVGNLQAVGRGAQGGRSLKLH